MELLSQRSISSQGKPCAGAELTKDILAFYRKEGVEPGIILVIKTSGRALNFNPHLHLLITEGGLDKDNEWRSLHYINQALLKKNGNTSFLPD